MKNMNRILKETGPAYHSDETFTYDLDYHVTPARKVLVVEDDLDLEPLIRASLRELDPHIEVDWEVDVESAIRKIKENATQFGWKPYDLVVADVFLEGDRTGIDLWDTLKTYYGEVPSIVISAADEERVMSMLDVFSAWPVFIQKPIEFEQFQSAAKYMMENSDDENSLDTP